MQNLKEKSDGSALYDQEAAKEPARLSVNGDLLRKASDLEIDLSTTLEGALASEIVRKRREIWREENREAIQAYNEFVAENGVFSTGLRGF
jgi:antitoxin CcdA